MPLHADQIQLSKLCGANYRSASDNGLLTDAFVAANNASIAVFDAAIGNVVNVHAEVIPQRGRLQRAFRYDNATQGNSDVTDSNLPSTTTVAALIALTQEPATSTARQIILE